MDISVVSLDEIKLAAIKVVGRPSELSHRVPLAWRELSGHLPSLPHVIGPDLFFGVGPESDHLTQGQHGVFTYFCGAPVSAFGALPAGLVPLTVPAEVYVSTTVRGRAEQIEASYLALTRWLQEQGRSTDPEMWFLERYDNRRQKVTPPYEWFDYDIFRPLVPVDAIS